MTAFETPSAGGDVRHTPRTDSSMGTVTGALEFDNSESPAGGMSGARVENMWVTVGAPLSPSVLVERPSRELTPFERDLPAYAGQGSRMDAEGDVADAFFDVNESDARNKIDTMLERFATKTTVVESLNASFNIRYLVPGLSGGWRREVLVATPKDGCDSSRASSTWFYFPKPRPDTQDVEVLGDRKNIVRNSGGLSDDCKVFKFDLPAVGDLPGTLSLSLSLSLFPHSFDDANSDTLIGVLSVLLPPPSPATSRGKH